MLILCLDLNKVSPFLVVFSSKFVAGTAKPNFLFRDGSSTTCSRRPLGDNEPKVTTTGMVSSLLLSLVADRVGETAPDLGFRDLEKYLTGILPLKMPLARAGWLHNESFYLHGTYVRSCTSSSTSLLRQPLCVHSTTFLLDSTNSYRSQDHSPLLAISAEVFNSSSEREKIYRAF